jgi:hypothetical protein
MKTVSDLLGKTLTNVENVSNERIVFTLDTGEQYMLWHSQDCCESVTVEDIAGDLKDLIGSSLTMAEESISNENPPGVDKGSQDSFTWTFYKFATVNGYVTIRWYGESNGYYSESVDFVAVSP